MQIGWRRARGLAVAGLVVAAAAMFAMACGGDDNDNNGNGKANMTPAATRTAATPASGGSMTPPAKATTAAGTNLGETPGWAAGQTGTVFYTKEFFCNTAPCVVGQAGMNPAGVSDPVPSVWVLVPLFKETSGLNFHCPTEGNCPTHPKELDVSRAGLGTVIALPPHNHIIDPNEAGFSGAGETPWKVVVVGVKTRAAWDELEAGKSLETLRKVQAEGAASATPDVPTNLILFFGVK